MRDFSNTLVQDVMQREVRTCGPDSSIDSAAKAMLETDITCLVVDFQDPAKGFGIVTQKDILVLVFADAVEVESTTVSEVMTHPTVVLAPQWSLETAVSLMRMMGVRRAPVIEGGALAGLLSFTDVFRHAMEDAS